MGLLDQSIDHRLGVFARHPDQHDKPCVALYQCRDLTVVAAAQQVTFPVTRYGTLCFQELQGFLFAVASCPEVIQPSDWLPVISNDEDIGFEDQSEAERIVSLINALYNQVNCAVMDRRNAFWL